jgi:hypothetical protein
MYQLVIIMFTALGVTDDAIQVERLNGQPLAFETHEQCIKHLWDNLDALKAFGRAQFGGVPVKSISCHKIKEIREMRGDGV